MHADLEPVPRPSGLAPAAPPSTAGRRCAARLARGFTLIEVIVALSLLLIGGVSILSVFTLAVSHRVERDIEARLDLVRPEARALAQEAVDRAAPGAVPGPIVDAATTQPGFTVSAHFVRSPNEDPGWVASIGISYRGQPLRSGRLPPLWLSRNTLDPPSR